MRHIVSSGVEAFLNALESLRANFLRSTLTSLGVTIGVTFVSLMGWALESLDAAWESTLSTLGSDMLYVDKWNWAGGGNWRTMMSRKNITIDQGHEIATRLRNVDMIIISADAWGQTLTFKDQSVGSIMVEGTMAQYALLPSTELAKGRFFTESEGRTTSYVAVIGYQVGKQLFLHGSPLGQTIHIKGKPFTIIGTMPKRGTVFTDFLDRTVYIPLETFFALYGRYSKSVTVAIKARTPTELDELREEVRSVVRAVRRLPPGAQDDFSINEAQVFRDQIATIRRIIWAVGLGLTALSFLVGVIGITNVMFVAVVERTREIGIRRSLGAQRSTILVQFLLEALLLCTAGAFVGVLVCGSLVWLVAFLLRDQAPFLLPILPANIVADAIVVSIAVGLLAGFSPALRASRLQPVEALRYEQ